MNAEERREARRRRILENPDSRLRKITTINTNQIVSNGHLNPVKHEPGLLIFFNRFFFCLLSAFFFFFSENVLPISELPNRTECRKTNASSPIDLEDRRTLNFDLKPNDLIEPKQNLHSRSVNNYSIKFPSVTVVHVILSQIVLAFICYDLGFVFGNVSDCI